MRKLGALTSYRYRNELFPASQFRIVWDTLRELLPIQANTRYLKIL